MPILRGTIPSPDPTIRRGTGVKCHACRVGSAGFCLTAFCFKNRIAVYSAENRWHVSHSAAPDNARVSCWVPCLPLGASMRWHRLSIWGSNLGTVKFFWLSSIYGWVTSQECIRHQFLTLSLRMLAQSGKHGTQKKAILRSSLWPCHYAAVHLWPDYHGASRRHLLSVRDLY